MDDTAKRSLRRRIIGWTVFLIPVALLVLLRFRFFMLAWITSRSMEPTLHKGDLVLINHAAFRNRLPAPGEIVALYTLDRQQLWVKRAVAGPGDVVLTTPTALYVNGRKVEEPYIRPDARPDYRQYPGRVRVPDRHVWVLGDNRGNSDDSRGWGPLRHDYVQGKVVSIVWPRARQRRLR